MRVLLLLSALLVPIAHAGAQEEPGRATGLKPGARLRVTAPENDRRPAHLVAASRESMTVLFDGDTTARQLRSAAVSRLELIRSRSRGRGALIGAALGLAGGAALGAVVGKVVEHPDCEDCLAVPILGAAGAGLGFVVGAVVGALSARERWQTMSARAGEPGTAGAAVRSGALGGAFGQLLTRAS